MTEAIVLVGGKGTRLRPLTVNTPKPMLPCAGVPFLTHQLARLKEVGVDHVVMAMAFRPQAFIDYYGDGSSLGLAIDYVTEEVPLDTGGGIRNVLGWLHSGPDDPVLVLNSDILSEHSLKAQLALHDEAEAAVTLHLTRVQDARAYGCVPTDPDGRVSAFLEKMPSPISDQVNAGCYVFRRRVIDEIPAGLVVSVERHIFPELLAAGQRVVGYLDDCYWLDVGTPAAFVKASADLVLGRVRSPAVPHVDGEVLVLPGGVVEASARVAAGTCVGRGAVVGAGAAVDGSVLFDGAIVEPGAAVSSSAIGAGARIGADTIVDCAVVGDGVRVGAGNELRAGIRVWPGTVLADGSVRFSSDVRN
ncbi:MAG TPA: NDP-sugar synthase [Actinomycetes bacterium]|jgi:mannose-1-phosphate guanylyltransferase